MCNRGALHLLRLRDARQHRRLSKSLLIRFYDIAYPIPFEFSDQRLPTIFSERDFVKAGALMSYGPSYSELFRRSADYVDKILHGAKPSDMPVEQPTKFELVINLKTAQA